jgi:hypothetical protein
MPKPSNRENVSGPVAMLWTAVLVLLAAALALMLLSWTLSAETAGRAHRAATLCFALATAAVLGRYAVRLFRGR